MKALIARAWAFAHQALLAALLAFVGGILFWGGFNTAMEWTNREAFCISCHEMERTSSRIPQHHSLPEPHRRARHLPGLPRAQGVGPEDDPQDPGEQ